MEQTKIEALANYLGVEANEITEGYYNEGFSCNGAEYLVLTEEEASDRVEEEIKNSLWAFRAEFIIEHCKNYEEMTMDEFYNANNRTWQMYLNDVRMYQYSLFANGVVFATEEPTVQATAIAFENASVTIGADVLMGSNTIITTPYNASATGLTVASSDTDVVTVAVDSDSPKTITITKVGAGTATITATLGNLTATCTVTSEVSP